MDRYMLLHAMRKSRPYKLFCVGDDWQSIYRFAGSDIDFILNFGKYWGAYEESKIESTYRFSQMLTDISSSFIMGNPQQKKKAIVGMKGYEKAIGEVTGYNEDYSIKSMLEKIKTLPQNASVFLIGRYSFDIQPLDNCEGLSYKLETTSDNVTVICKDRPDLKIRFLTVHKSKGLQTDYVFIINNKDSVTGFPSQIEDAPILDLLLGNHDTYPFAEERRLFYVAITRARKTVYLVTIKGKKSIFAQEIERDFGDYFEDPIYICPMCGGQLERKKGPYGFFYGCSNYYNPEIQCHYTKDIASIEKK
jgi:DNA helicase-4